VKFLCPTCQALAEATRYRVERGTLHLHCAQCGVESATDVPEAARSVPDRASTGSAKILPLRAELAPRAASAAQVPTPQPRPPSSAQTEVEPLAVPDGYCPKCISPRSREAPACGQCGLVFDSASPEEYQPAPALLASWIRLLGAWEDPSGHERFLREASTQGELAATGRLYRIRLAQAPDDPLARRGRDEVIRLATAAASLSIPTGMEEKGTPTWKVVLAVFVAGATLAAVIAFVRALVWFGK
jgi:hypothetical protein